MQSIPCCSSSCRAVYLTCHAILYKTISIFCDHKLVAAKLNGLCILIHSVKKRRHIQYILPVWDKTLSAAFKYSSN